MRRIVLVFLILLLAMPLAIVGAQDTPDLTTLAEAFPEGDTLFYAAIRTDDGFIETLDGLLRPFYPLADDLPPNFTLEMGLDLAVMEAELGTSFNTAVRPWLGDSAALGIFLSPECATNPTTCDADNALDDAGVVIAVELSDRDAAIRLLEGAMNETSDVQMSEVGGFTVYEEQSADELLAIGTDYAIFGTAETIRTNGLLSGDYAALADSADLADAIGSLPADAYNALVYLNAPALVESLESLADNPGIAMTDTADAITVFRLFDSAVAGATILGGNTLALDALVATSIDVAFNDTGIDPAFAANIPADTPLVIHSANLAGAYDVALESLNAVAEFDSETSSEDIRTGLAFGDSLLTGFLGLSIEDLIGWIESDYALFVNAADGASPMLESNPVEIAFVADASGNVEAALNVVDGLEAFVNGEFVASVVEREDVPLRVETTREGDVLSVSAEETTGEVPFPLMLRVGVVDGVFFIATPGTADAIASGDMQNLAATEAFGAAGDVLLDGSTSVYYADAANIANLLALVASFDPSTDQQELEDVLSVLALLESATISQTNSADGVQRTRATISLR